ncbi:MAG: hypothetical protein ACRD68_01950 [Pyrinomonadaceae bacterium]
MTAPIVIDMDGDGFNLTDANSGVRYDMGGDGYSELVAWTEANADDDWLVLDRNNNGTIETGQELFGNFTPQPTPPPGASRNGFLALAEFDKVRNGGNRDGWIGPQDAIFSSLRLWRDVNHDGISQADEIHSLPSLGVMRLDLDYKESKRTDEHRNRFKYRAKVRDARDAQVGRWAWDVILVTEGATTVRQTSPQNDFALFHPTLPSFADQFKFIFRSKEVARAGRCG